MHLEKVSCGIPTSGFGNDMLSGSLDTSVPLHFQGNMNMESELAATVEAQGKQLLAQGQRIQELERRLENILSKTDGGDDTNQGNEANNEAHVSQISLLRLV